MVPYVSCYSPLLFFCVCGQTGFSNQIKTGIVIFNEKWDKTKEIVRIRHISKKMPYIYPRNIDIFLLEHVSTIAKNGTMHCELEFVAIW